VLHGLHGSFKCKSTMLIDIFLNIVLMIRVEGYLIDKIHCPKGTSQKNVENHCCVQHFMSPVVGQVPDIAAAVDGQVPDIAAAVDGQVPDIAAAVDGRVGD